MVPVSEDGTDFVVEVAMPSHHLLFRPIGVGDGFVVNPVLPDGVSFGSLHTLLQNTANRGAADLYPPSDLDAGRITARPERRAP